MTLLPDEVRAQLPRLHSEQETASEPVAYAKLISQPEFPSVLTFFVLELDREDQDTMLVYMLDDQQGKLSYLTFSYLEYRLVILTPEEYMAVVSGQKSSEDIPSAVRFDPTFTLKPLSQAIAEEGERRVAEGLDFIRPIPLSQQNRPYYYARCYQQESVARHVYTTIQDLNRSEQVSLSVYRFLQNRAELPWHVVVIGNWPEHSYHQRIMHTLRNGTPATIEYDLLMSLYERRQEEAKHGTYREHHNTVILRRQSQTPNRKWRREQRGK